MQKNLAGTRVEFLPYFCNWSFNSGLVVFIKLSLTRTWQTLNPSRIPFGILNLSDCCKIRLEIEIVVTQQARANKDVSSLINWYWCLGYLGTSFDQDASRNCLSVGWNWDFGDWKRQPAIQGVWCFLRGAILEMASLYFLHPTLIEGTCW